jgi:hypothetical protein
MKPGYGSIGSVGAENRDDLEEYADYLNKQKRPKSTKFRDLCYYSQNIFFAGNIGE